VNSSRFGGPARVASAWAVHAFTATGAVLAFLALMAILEANWPLALVWLLAALAVDGIDGSLARWARVKEGAPRIDGAALDLIIDYLNYVFVPAVLIWRAGLVPGTLAPALIAAILVSALYNFTRLDMKTPDNYFRGFPALWNLVAFYLFVTRPSPEWAALAIALLAALTFAPVHFVHPFRVRDYGRWLPLLACLWAAATAALLWPGWSEGARAGLLGVSVASGAALLALGLLRTARGPRATEESR
jgi:phosphatidylcholine synthase